MIKISWIYGKELKRSGTKYVLLKYQGVPIKSNKHL